MTYLLFRRKRRREIGRRDGMQFLPQLLQPLLYLSIKGVLFSEVFENFIGFLKMTLLEINLSNCLRRHMIHRHSDLKGFPRKLEKNSPKVNPFAPFSPLTHP
jgi:hypothetical protein